MHTYTTEVSSVVFINGDGISVVALQKLADTFSLPMKLKVHSAKAIRKYKNSGENIVVVELSDHLFVPFSITDKSAIWICGSMMKNLCQYVRIEQESYFLLMLLLAMTQINTVKNNELLKAEYLIHDSNCNCLFSQFTDFMKWFTSFEELFICKGSVDFYNCLGNEYEIECIQKLIDQMNEAIQKV